jgi:DNA-binding FrmR family transcriptional regulator
MRGHTPILTPGPPTPGGYDANVNEETRKDVTARLRSVAGHLKAVERMVEEDKYCVDVLKQTMAIEKALERVDALVLEQHLETCVADAFRQGRAEKTIKELAEIFSTARK